MATSTLKETPLAAAHRALGARMVDFAGWNMPVQYKSIVAEHMAVRTKAGIFDVSHMGEFVVTGEARADYVQRLIANDVNRLTEPNRALYTQLVNEDGGTVDDLIVYRRENDFLLVVNASNIQKDWNWLKKYLSKFPGVEMKNESDQTGLLALQGPEAVGIWAKIAGDSVKDLGSFHYGEATIDGVKVGFGRTGYTGEDGFEIFVPSDKTEWLWKKILEVGQPLGLEPCGLGARDTLRLEAGLPLYGHELDENTSPIEAGLGWSVKVDKGAFIGRDMLVRQKTAGVGKQIVCLKADGKALPRQHYPVYSGDSQVGEVTSGSQGIFVGYPIAFAAVTPKFGKVGQELTIAIRDSRVKATVVARPWYKRK